MRPTIISLARRGTTTTSENQQSPSPTTPPSRPPRQQRLPLQSRDNNAMMRAPQKGAPLGSRSANATPQFDKQSFNVAARPVLPTLSTAATKAANKTPLTPRVAASTPSVASTPLTRKNARQDGSSTPTGSHRDEFSTPVLTFLSHTNVTPRSSSRKSRVDSTNTTPIGTPTAPETLLFANDTSATDLGGGLGLVGLNSGPRAALSHSPAISEVGGQHEQATASGDAKFFYASDAKTHPLRYQPQPFQSKQSTFFYANGDTVPPPVSVSGSIVGSVVGSTLDDERPHSRFLNLDRSPDIKSPPIHDISSQGSTTSMSSHITSPRLATHSSVGNLSLRAASPPKSASPSVSFSTLRRPPIAPSAISSRPHPVGRGYSAPEKPQLRRVSIETPLATSSHEKTASLGSLDFSLAARSSSNTPLISPDSPKESLNFVTKILEPTPMDTTDERIEKENAALLELQSAVNPGQSLERMSELAANARRERKVLDLEITNSSLAAINRTLEREMRKQTAELRRFRRLSRSGRLSIATSASMRTSTGTLSIMDGSDGTPLSDMSEEDADEEDDESSEEESIDDSSLSPRALAESDARHRIKDEKRLQLDLSKHQQLLIDSQKMNQSLKRCLGWTEELINEGKRALAYHVRVSDIELGGRVLAPDDLDENDRESLTGVVPSLVRQTREIAIAHGGWAGAVTDESQTSALISTETSPPPGLKSHGSDLDASPV